MLFKFFYFHFHLECVIFFFLAGVGVGIGSGRYHRNRISSFVASCEFQKKKKTLCFSKLHNQAFFSLAFK